MGYKHARQTNLSEILPIIGQAAEDVAENSWRHTEYEDDCTLEEINKQREAIYSYGGYALFDTGHEGFGDPVEVRNGHAVHIVGESQAYNPLRFGTSWVIEFDDGYTGVAYFDELHRIDSQDSIDYFGKSLTFDMRGSIYSIASQIANGEILVSDKEKAIDDEFYKLYDSKKKLFADTVAKVVKDLQEGRKEEWSEFRTGGYDPEMFRKAKTQGYDKELFHKVATKTNKSMYENVKK